MTQCLEGHWDLSHCSWKPKAERFWGLTYEKSIHSFIQSYILCFGACPDSGHLVVRDRQPSPALVKLTIWEKADYAI